MLDELDSPALKSVVVALDDERDKATLDELSAVVIGEPDEIAPDDVVVESTEEFDVSEAAALDVAAVRLSGSGEVALLGDTDMVVDVADEPVEDVGTALGCTLSALMMSAA